MRKSGPSVVRAGAGATRIGPAPVRQGSGEFCGYPRLSRVLPIGVPTICQPEPKRDPGSSTRYDAVTFGDERCGAAFRADRRTLEPQSRDAEQAGERQQREKSDHGVRRAHPCLANSSIGGTIADGTWTTHCQTVAQPDGCSRCIASAGGKQKPAGRSRECGG